jgi:hypothetical protein
MRSKSLITLMPGYIFNVVFYSDATVAFTGFSFSIYLNTTSTQTATTIKPTTTTTTVTATTALPTTTASSTTVQNTTADATTTTIAAATAIPAGGLKYKFNIVL